MATVPRQSASQEKRILHLLSASYPSWVPAPSLAKISLQYCRAISALRKIGWEIANRVEHHHDGTKHGFYRLATPLTFPNPRRPAVPMPAGDSLFGELTIEHKDLG